MKAMPPTFLFLLNVVQGKVSCHTYWTVMWSSSTKTDGATVSQMRSTQ